MRVVNLRVVALFLFGMFAMAMGPGSAWLGATSTAVAQDNPFGDSTEVAAQNDPFAASKPARGTVTRRAPAVFRDEVASVPKASDEISSVESDSPSSDTMEDNAIREKLSAKCDFDLYEVPFSNVKEELESKLGVNIILTPSAYEDQVTEDEAFTSNLSGITYSSALRTILAGKNATYCIHGGAIELISLDEAYDEKWCARRMINVSETLKLIRVAEKDRIGKPVPGSISVSVQGQPVVGGVFGLQFGGTSMTKPAAKPTAEREESKEIKQLADAILQAVKNAQPRTQRVVELVTAESILIDAIQETVFGEYNDNFSITCVGGVLIAKAPEEVNDRVESFVEDLTFGMKAAAKNR